MKETIKLFNAVPITTKRTKKSDSLLLKKTIKKGFIFSPEVVYNYSEKELNKLISVVEFELGLTAEKMNNSFHKSWNKIKTASMEQLITEQLIHYITTYGFESLGIYDKKLVFIPKEKLEIPELKEDIKLVVIKGYTKKEIKEKLLRLLQSGIALKEDTINDVIKVAEFVEIKEKEIESIMNKEVKIILYDKLDLLPENPIEFLRYVIYKLTEKTLLIKDFNTINDIKDKSKILKVNGFFVKYKRDYGLEKLASIFYRFKPIFLALKTNSQMNAIVNKIRRLAVKNHIPMKEDYLNSITGKLKNKETIVINDFEEKLSKANVFRKIRLAYALKYRTKDVESILYRIRNGNSYATKFNFNNKKNAKGALNIVLDSIIKDISKNVKGKKIYIPDYINYTLPATEKQFTGNFPSGTYVSIPKDMIVGIHWENVDNNRIDLDLSMLNITTGKIGWDQCYTNEEKSILFSGDITDAPKPKGASELFYIKRQREESFILSLNYYNFDDDYGEVPFKIIVAKEQACNLKNNYTVDPNNVITINKTKINKQQMILGLLVTTTNESKFYFTETSIGKSRTSTNNNYMENSRKYLFDFYKNAIGLNDILVKAGAKLVKNKEKCDINLSPEDLEKDSILNLMLGGK